MSDHKHLEGAPPQKKIRLSLADEIRVLVGHQKKKFTIPLHVICARSPFFKAACSKKWAGDSKIIELPEDDADIFDIYMYCVYHNRVDVGDLQDPLIGEEDRPQGSRVDTRLVRTYFLADKLADIVTANLLIDALLRFSEATNAIPSLDIDIILNKTSLESPLRRLFIDIYVYESNAAAINDLMTDSKVPKQFVCEVLLEKTKLCLSNHDKKISAVFSTTFTSRHRCRYHQHDEARPHCGEGCTEGKDK